MRSILILAVIFAVVFIVYKNYRQNSLPELKTVEYVDTYKYMGIWYEIARYPNRFERKCASNAKAAYELLPNKKIRVENSCLDRNGKLIKSVGTATVVDKKTNAKLKVSFFGPFGGDYYVMALDMNYRYAVVGDPERKYLWVLSRTKTLGSSVYDRLLNKIEVAGYDVSKIQKTVQK